ncbi:hypothetical protein J1614_000993 [Plenodomus biglobosus]|nr:hypothetical protein J1614_000993 [Plenodomus biglobosus]
MAPAIFILRESRRALAQGAPSSLGPGQTILQQQPSRRCRACWHPRTKSPETTYGLNAAYCLLSTVQCNHPMMRGEWQRQCWARRRTIPVCILSTHREPPRREP